jgi:hypothetical protein
MKLVLTAGLLAMALAGVQVRTLAAEQASLVRIGTVAPRAADTIAGQNWLLGCETLDRDYTDYEAYKAYLAPLGIRRLRMQAGWAKTEKVKGEYDWAWLDRIVGDAAQRGLRPWLQLSYGNGIYAGGGGTNLSAGIPVSPESLAAWDRWVEALVLRYRDRVVDWEVWNEPNFGDNTINAPEAVAALSARTAAIVKRLQPQAKISGLALGHIDFDYAERFFRTLADAGRIRLFDNMTYHDYVYNPDSHYARVERLRDILHKYAPGMPLRQGENGAPSVPNSGGALGNYAWSEISQAKWNTRRMLGDLGHDIESSVFSIMEMHYTGGPISTFNTKGILKSGADKQVIRPKLAYRAIQTVTSVFDERLRRLPRVEHSFNDKLVPADPQEVRWTISSDRAFSVYGYRHPQRQLDVYTLWMADAIPGDALDKKSYQVTLANARFDQPVVVDVLSGAVYEIPSGQWSRRGAMVVFKNIPLYDGPVLIADRALIEMEPAAVR